MTRSWDATIQALVLVRAGQELGSNSELAQYVAATIDFFIHSVAKFF